MRRFFPILMLPLLAFALCGCRTPMPPGAATSGLRLGPFFETAHDEAGSSMVAVRPFFSRETTPTNAPDLRVETDVAWPLGISSRRDDHFYWRALLFYGMGVDDAPDSPGDPSRFRLFPLFFTGHTLRGEDYAAVFPLGGTIRNFLVFSEVSFFLFPIYAEGRTAGVEFRSVLWPFYLTRHGEHVDQLRVWPFYGEAEHRGKRITTTNRFVLWPLWTETSSYGAVSGDGFVLFPLFGHSHYEREKRGDEESWTFLPPLFSYGRGDDGYRRLNAPWPFVRFLDMDDHHERHLWPLYGRSERRGLHRDYFLWPFFSKTRVDAGRETNSVTHVAMPLYFHREKSVADADGAITSRRAYSRLWPFFSYRDGDAGVSFRFPELSLWSGSQQVERNWAPLWSFYTYRKKPDGAYCNDVLWGFCSWGRNAEGGRIFSFLWIPFSR